MRLGPGGQNARPVRAQTAMGRSAPSGRRTSDLRLSVCARVEDVVARLVVEAEQGAPAGAQRGEALRRDDLGDLLRRHRLREGSRYFDESCDPLWRGEHHDSPIDT